MKSELDVDVTVLETPRDAALPRQSRANGKRWADGLAPTGHLYLRVPHHCRVRGCRRVRVHSRWVVLAIGRGVHLDSWALRSLQAGCTVADVDWTCRFSRR